MRAMNTLILYHANCSDGFGSAYLCWRHFGDAATYMAMEYSPPEHLMERVLRKARGANVYLVDYSFKKAGLLRLLEVADHVTVLDHHLHEGDDSIADVVHERLTMVLDTSECGASLCWNHFFGGRMPRLIKYIRDRDLWLHLLPHTKEVNAGIAIMPRSFEVWDRLDVVDLIEKGRIILEVRNREIEQHTRRAHRMDVTFEGTHWEGAAVCAPHHVASDLAVNVYKDRKVGFAAVYSINPNTSGTFDVMYSFRVAPDCDLDAAALCRTLGGGGHRRAAGCRQTVEGKDLHTALTRLTL